MGTDIHSLCTWKKANTEDAVRAFKLGRIFEERDIGADAHVLFGDVPDTYVHKGDVSLETSMLLNAAGHGIFIIDGSLSVEGALTFFAHDAYTILVVTGDLRATHFQQARDTQLVVVGETTIEGLLHINLSDAGFAVFCGPVTSRDRVVVDNNCDPVKFLKKPKGKAREFSDYQEVEALHAKLVRGDDLFPALPKGVKKPPSNAAIAKMTSAAEVLSTITSGFEEMTFAADGAVNPNYFRKGKLGEPLQRLRLENTYLPEFPDSLVSLQELTLCVLDDQARLAPMMSSLSKLRALKKLQLRGVKLERFPTEILSLGNLEELELIGSDAVEIPAGIEALTNLKVLEIAGNACLTSLPAAIGSLKNIEVLRITDNATLAKIPVEVGSLENLKTLDIDECPALTSLPAQIGSLKHLTSLSICSNTSLSALPSEFRSLRLASLHLKGNGLTRLPDFDLDSFGFVNVDEPALKIRRSK